MLATAIRVSTFIPCLPFRTLLMLDCGRPGMSANAFCFTPRVSIA